MQHILMSNPSPSPNRRPLMKSGSISQFQTENRWVLSCNFQSCFVTKHICLFQSPGGNISRGSNDLLRRANAKYFSSICTFHQRMTTANEGAAGKALRVSCWTQEWRGDRPHLGLRDGSQRRSPRSELASAISPLAEDWAAAEIARRTHRELSDFCSPTPRSLPPDWDHRRGTVLCDAVCV